jgi:hypothetical protein
MPRYFFDTHDGDAFIEDKEGIELGGMAPARRVALRVLAGMAHDMVLEGMKPQRLCVFETARAARC